MATDDLDSHAESPDTAPDLGRISSDLTLAELGRGCTTAGTEGLSTQLLEEMLCLADGALVEVSHPNVVPTSSRVHLLLSPEGRDMLLRAAASSRIEINSAFRTLAEQYVLYRGCSVAARPGRSNHESGRAIDVGNWRSVGSTLTAAGFSHPMPSRDPVHYEAPGDDWRSISVRAFQRLWNANHPEDTIAEDGNAGSGTLDRLARSPATGFRTGSVCTTPATPPADTPPAPPADPPAGGAGCTHSFGGAYGHLACSASYQCCDGAWRTRASGCGTCACVETTGMTGCSATAEPPPPDAPPAPPAPPPPGGFVLPPEDAGLDYQLGGAYPPPAGVGIVARDRTASPVPGLYNICYVNGFQIQPGEESWWSSTHPSVMLRDGSGRLVIDADWDEVLLDTSTAAKRAEIAGVINGWIRGCAEAGFQAVEIDNLDSYSRSRGLLTEDGAVALVRLFADAAHAAGLAIAQKNSAEIVERRAEMGTDFAVTEQCNQYSECDVYTRSYGSHVLVIEYNRGAFATGCSRYPGLSIVLRDLNLVAPGSGPYVFDGC